MLSPTCLRVFLYSELVGPVDSTASMQTPGGVSIGQRLRVLANQQSFQIIALRKI